MVGVVLSPVGGNFSSFSPVVPLFLTPMVGVVDDMVDCAGVREGTVKSNRLIFGLGLPLTTT